jgi:hypothetical protein
MNISMNLLQAFNLLNSINEGAENYEERYKQHLIDHKRKVSRFADWLKYKLPEVFEDVDLDAFDEVIKEHDESKFSEPEFSPYARFWANDSDDYEWDPEYEDAYEHHLMNNEHHPEHWLGQDMPKIYILEMLCDWGSFYVDGNLKELVDYYYEEAKDDDEKNLSDNTKVIVEEILEKIKAA